MAVHKHHQIVSEPHVFEVRPLLRARTELLLTTPMF
jgi:hypothetical protein